MAVTRRGLLQGAAAASCMPVLPLWAGIDVGTMRIDTLSDGHLTLPADFIFGPMPQDAIAPIRAAHGLTGDTLTSPCTVTLMRRGDQVVLFDAGAGSGFQPTVGALVDALAGLDIAPEDVTHVVFTHAHPDHIWGVLDDFDDPLFTDAAHLIGRGLYLRGNAVSDAGIVKATLLELAVIPLGAAVIIVSMGALGLLSGLLPWFPDVGWYATALILCIAIACALLLPLRGPVIEGRQIAQVLPAVGLAAVFMLCLGGTFAAVFNLLSDAPVAVLTGAGIIAWLVGYLTPGAPGGIGTREAALIALLSYLNQEDTVLIATALFRVVTTLGDVLLFLGSWLNVPRGASAGETSNN